MSTLTRKLAKGIEIVRYSFVRAVAAITGVKPRHRAPDRVLFDETILPALARDPRYARILFVGCDWYTEHVEDIFRGREFTTLEVDPGRARHGARRHITDALSALGRHFAPGSLDLIVCNGVIGWGLDDPAEIARSLEACAATLSPGGVLLVGWDDVPEKRPLDVAAAVEATGLRPATPGGFAAARIETGSYARHVFGFWARPD